MHLSDNIIVSVLLLAGAFVSVRRKKLTAAAGLTGVVVGGLIYLGDGYTGVAALAVFFIMGTVATGWRQREKGGVAQTTRRAGQVIANGGVAALAGLGILCFPSYRPELEVALAGSISAAAADTLSSELGMVYGRSFYNILSWKRDRRGLDGVVSLEGLLIGVAGSAVIGLVYGLGHGWKGGIWIIVLSGTVGNLLDSVLGAAFERRGYIGNDTVNFLNTLAAGLLAGFLALAQ